MACQSMLPITPSMDYRIAEPVVLAIYLLDLHSKWYNVLKATANLKGSYGKRLAAKGGIVNLYMVAC